VTLKTLRVHRPLAGHAAKRVWKDFEEAEASETETRKKGVEGEN